MRYKLYTLVDITRTRQYRNELGREKAWRQEQNFNTVLQTLGLRSNVHFFHDPEVLNVGGHVVGFDTDDLIKVWRFDFETEGDNFFESDGDPIGFLLQDFHLVPYINGLDEELDQDIPVFNTQEPGRNIVFYKKQS